ncbi:MAG: Cys-tRNA(Pro) deacylase [Clostridia bacterium]|nr:Cys-tRNA(Pro) deacylase [Clostridia bacterium]
MAKKMQKTNAMRILDTMKIPYAIYEYPHGDEAVRGDEVAALIGKDPSQVYKTLVLRGHSKEIYVFVVAVNEELDLKKCALAVKEKSVEMIKVSELLPLTGYIRGGCTAIGMKKKYRVTLSDRAKELDTITVSAGKIGMQMELKVEDYIRATEAGSADIVL